MTDPLLEIDDIHVHYGRLAAVRGVSMRVEPGEIVCVVGPNGAGKSTTLLATAGVLSPTRGAIRIGGFPIAGMAPEKVARLGLSMVPEGRHIFGTLTVEENLRIGTYQRTDRRDVERELKRILEEFPVLAERRGTNAAMLSGGEQQQLAIGRALLTGAKILLVDEPSLGLAPMMIERVYDILTGLRDARGITLLIVEESAERALDVADRIYVMRRGLVELAGTSSELEEGARLQQAYFGFGGDEEDARVRMGDDSGAANFS
jgi:branched-chain amino acid transport system ATP-binding protein